MTVEEFLENYGGNGCITIEGYCEEKNYDYFVDVEDWKLTDDNSNHYKPTCIVKEPWWDAVKDRTITFWNIIGGYGDNPLELTIELEN